MNSLVDVGNTNKQVTFSDLSKYVVSKSKINKLYDKYPYYKSYKYYKIPKFDDKISEYLGNKSLIGVKYKSILEEISSVSGNIYIVGGVVRDILIGKDINDIDINFDASADNIEELCLKNDWLCYINLKFKYLKISDNIEGFYETYKIFRQGNAQHDFTVNNLIYDTKNKIIIDLTGKGLIDILNRKIRIPVGSSKYEKWADLRWEKCLRFFKLVLSGFEPYDTETTDFVVGYIEKNFEDIYFKPARENSLPRIKEFVIKSVTYGTIIDKDRYCYGKKLNNIVPYIRILKKFLDVKIVKKIYKLLNEYPYCLATENKTKYNSYVVEDFEKVYDKFILKKVGESSNLNSSNLNNSYANIFKQIMTITDNVYLYGGGVRDMLLGVEPGNVNIMFDSDLTSVKKLCSKNKWPCSTIIDKYKYVIFGEKRGVTLEGHYKLNAFDQKVINYDFTVNQLVYDTKNNVIYDLTGNGLKDTLTKKIRIPTLPGKYEEWAKKNWKHPLIYFKLKLKGFSPRHEEMEKFIVGYIESNFETVYMKKDANGNENIKNYLVKVLTHGEVYKDGTYKLGENKARLMKYIKILSESLGHKYIKMIVGTLSV